MKKVMYSLLAGVFFLAACGPSAEEQAAEQKRIADSVAAAEQARIQDSLMQAEKMYQDSIALVATRVADSLRAVAIQDSINAANKKPARPKKSQEQINQEKLDKEVKDATRGRG
jgi:hypothetical protein